MRLLFSEPVGDRAHDRDGCALPGMTVRVVATGPLPDDRAAWRRELAGGDDVHEAAHTPTGWPLAIVRRERRLLGFYELYDRGVVVAVTGDGDLDLVRASELLRAADLDRRPRELVALSQLWER